MRTKGIKTGAWLGAAAALGLALIAPAEASKPKKPTVEAVFVLDTTGSMGGLIEGAKQKIWSIANEIATGKPAPDIKMGLIAYRDRSDAYVTKTFDLSRNLDKMYKELLALRAAGGGDGPEHVLKGLEEAIERVSWSEDSEAYKVIFLVGDAPAHTDYNDTPRLEKLTERAVRKGIIINTVQCGSDESTTTQWRRIARLGEGKFLPIPHDGGVIAVATPFDDRIAELNSRLEGTMLGYGRRKKEARGWLGLAKSVSALASAPAAAERAVYKAKAGFSDDLDFVTAVEGGKRDIDKMSADELPDSFKGLSNEERKRRVKEISAKRAKLRREIDELSGKRARYLKKHTPKGPKDGFDSKLVDSLKEQASSKGIAY